MKKKELNYQFCMRYKCKGCPNELNCNREQEKETDKKVKKLIWGNRNICK